MSKVEKKLSIIIPVYNEKNAIIDTVREVKDIMDTSELEYEIITVNDGSKDGSLEVLEGFLKENPQYGETLRVVSHEVNKGYGASLKTGIRSSRYDNICITDADATYPNNRIPDLFGEYEAGYDMVVGKRSFKKLPTLTKPAKWFITSLANYLVDDKIEDLNSGLRIFRKDLAMKFFPIICDGFSFTTTITLAMMTNNYRVKYIPIDYLKREGKSKIKPIRDTLNFITLIIRTVLYFNPLKVFVPMSLFMFLLAVIFYVVGKMGYLFSETPVDTVTILFVTSVQILVMGMIADMIDKRIEK